MKIAICDDSIKDIQNIVQLLEEYKGLHKETEFEVERFTDAGGIKDKVQQKEFADIYILDILMSDTTGIDLGSYIRKVRPKSIIIYITSSDDYALDAYEVQAVRYLLKPIDKSKFFEALTYALSIIDVKKGPVYLVKTKEGLVPILHSKIEYIESYSRMLEVHLTDGRQIKSIFLRKAFEEEVGALAEDRAFMQVHKSFLVNMDCIKRLDGSSVIMESGVSIPISRKNAAHVKREYLLFVAEQYR
ncbi:DNA-binding response regulator [Lachnospiraceae bacterium]|nr:DNA-binding response regulator [Lachnospiraceae bacterium]